MRCSLWIGNWEATEDLAENNLTRVVRTDEMESDERL